jgi:FkbM family methyltransferase
LTDGLRAVALTLCGNLRPVRFRASVAELQIGTSMVLDTILRAIPIASYRPLRQAILSKPRRHPARIASTLVLKRAAAAYRHHLAEQMEAVVPLDMPDLSFTPTDSMVMDEVFWFGVRGYEGVVARTWVALCARASSVLEVGGNVGLFAVIGGRATAGAYTVVEPVPAIAAILRGNLARNGVDRVEVLEAAAVPGPARPVRLNIPDERHALPVGAHLDEGSEVSGRSSRTVLEVRGVPIAELAEGRDLIKIDAEGIEAALLSEIRPMLAARRPTLLIEVLPDSARLGALLREIAVDCGYGIYALPEYGRDDVVAIDPAAFSSASPAGFNAKDVVLSVGPPPG